MTKRKFTEGWVIALFPSLGISTAIICYLLHISPYPNGNYIEWLYSLIFFVGFQIFWLFAGIKSYFGSWYNAFHRKLTI